MSEWISVSERLPDENRPEVLFYCKSFKRVELGKYNEFTKEWMVPFSSYAIPVGDVSHWMPLPDAPK